jgi:hypothetical protein
MESEIFLIIFLIFRFLSSKFLGNSLKFIQRDAEMGTWVEYFSREIECELLVVVHRTLYRA